MLNFEKDLTIKSEFNVVFLFYFFNTI